MEQKHRMEIVRMLKSYKSITSFAGLLVLSLVLTANCGASRDIAYSKDYAPRTDKFEKLPKDLKAKWDNRHKQADLADAISGLEDLHSKAPGDYGVMLKLCLGNYLMADGHLYLKMDDSNKKSIMKEQEEYFDKAVKWCERAMATNEAFHKQVTADPAVPFEVAIKSLTKKEVDALYWKYAALAKWSRLKGLMTLLENKATFTAINVQVEKIDRNFFHAAVLRYKAAANLASPTGNKKEGKQQFEKAIKIAPHYFGAKVLYVDLGLRPEEDKAEKLLNEVINGDPNKIPDIRSEQIIEQKKAAKLLKEILE